MPGWTDGRGSGKMNERFKGICHFVLQKPTKQVYAFATESWESAESKFTSTSTGEGSKSIRDSEILLFPWVHVLFSLLLNVS